MKAFSLNCSECLLNGSLSSPSGKWGLPSQEASRLNRKAFISSRYQTVNLCPQTSFCGLSASPSSVIYSLAVHFLCITYSALHFCQLEKKWWKHRLHWLFIPKFRLFFLMIFHFYLIIMTFYLIIWTFHIRIFLLYVVVFCFFILLFLCHASSLSSLVYFCVLPVRLLSHFLFPFSSNPFWPQ